VSFVDGYLFYSYDALNRLTSVTYPIGTGKMTTYYLDAVGRRTKMTDPDSGNTTYEYDAGNRLTKLTNPDSQSTTFLYDAINRVTKQTNHNGSYAAYFYDGGGRLTTRLENKKSGGTVISTLSPGARACGR
jgi:YD repeat-containing protein